ncbi:BREX-3 system P-loop-containing protein BrxF [Veillonella criceti]|uniref:(+)RNA virus helicase C-terminal domain-containing protein n=1 Tax=Veillonella criceti TaxID=103891 RepID=A0A380NM48_9FIRM|nr:BREX-3 system P-loop-containing protein BrxF [Veillonella criceti]SUP44498.1 Uncharacterised protein [Veillonella criceti]
MVTTQDIKERWASLQNDEERILFVVGGPGSGKSKLIRELAEQDGWKYIEAKDLIEEEFLEVARDLRPDLAKDVMCKALKACGSDVILLDGVNVLFAPILNLEPIELLKTISRMYPLVVGWRGKFDGETLFLEHNNNPKYFSFKVEKPERIVTID